MQTSSLVRMIFLKGLMLFSINPSFCQNEIFQGQEPAKEVPTVSRKIDVIEQKTFAFNQGRLTFSCDFLTGRLNNMVQKNDSVFTATIIAENYPVNPSPWYAFYVTGKEHQRIFVQLTYEQGKHRYHPKISRDGRNWNALDSSRIQLIEPGNEKFGVGSMPLSAVLTLDIPQGDTLWVAAQEITSSKDVQNWINTKRGIRQGVAGYSTYGKAIRYFTIGKTKKNKPSVVVISRQHPPEVTGYFAMQKFVDVLLSPEKLSRKYRRKYVTYVLPLMNPDGVDNGHWRHNAGGIDLNRDWKQQNQPEVKQVNHFLDSSMAANNSKLIFFIDFHSTWDDIFYTNSVTHPSNMPGLMDATLKNMESALNLGKLNIRPSAVNESFVSKGYFYNQFKAESITYEVGDNTSRETIQHKGQVAARSFLKALFDRK